MVLMGEKSGFQKIWKFQAYLKKLFDYFFGSKGKFMVGFIGEWGDGKGNGKGHIAGV